jgi:ankyrin repeat protein
MRGKSLSELAFVMLFVLMSAVQAQSGDLCNDDRPGSLARVKQLLEQGIDVNAGDEDRRTHLHYAAYCGRIDAAALLIKKGANVNACDSRQSTPLHFAASGGHANVADLLIKEGADVNPLNDNRTTPLHLAAGGGYTEVVDLLIRKGVNINARNKIQRTPLHEAALGGNADVAALLIRKGADVNARDKNGETAWLMAVEGRFHNVTAVLKDAGAKEAYDALNWSGQYSTVKDAHAMTITNRSMWHSLWTKILHSTPPVDIDFNRYIAVCVFLGTRPTGGYGIEFGSPCEEDGKMIIPFRERKPTGLATQALTTPFAVKVFERKKDLGIIVKKEYLIDADR